MGTQAVYAEISGALGEANKAERANDRGTPVGEIRLRVKLVLPVNATLDLAFAYPFHDCLDG